MPCHIISYVSLFYLALPNHPLYPPHLHLSTQSSSFNTLPNTAKRSPEAAESSVSAAQLGTRRTVDRFDDTARPKCFKNTSTKIIFSDSNVLSTCSRLVHNKSHGSLLFSLYTQYSDLEVTPPSPLLLPPPPSPPLHFH